jgi:hypothetical protein
VRRYNAIRLSERSSPKRTTKLEVIVRDMRKVLQDAQGFDVRAHLDSPNGGVRMVGFAYLYDNPDPSWAPALSDTLIEKEDTAFGQYWGLEALRRQCERDASALPLTSRSRLEKDLKPQLPPGSSRARVLEQVLEHCAR